MVVLADLFHAVRHEVDDVLQQEFVAAAERMDAISPRTRLLSDQARDLTLRGGKRLRALLVHAGFSAVEGQTPVAATAKVGAAVELLQSYLLIHDDWMDDDALRRGGPSVHAALAESHESHVANSLAVLCGDLTSAQAWALLVEATPASCVHDVCRVFARIQEEVIAGQHLDVAEDPDVARMHDLKTTSYTVRGPLQLGAALAGADAKTQSSLAALAAPLGQAFQRRDDLLGSFGGTADKPGDDVAHGKRNAVWQTAQRLLAEPEWREVSEQWGQADADIEGILAMLERAGVAAAIESEIEGLVASANALIDEAKLNPHASEMLRSLTGLLAYRTL